MESNRCLLEKLEQAKEIFDSMEIQGICVAQEIWVGKLDKLDNMLDKLIKEIENQVKKEEYEKLKLWVDAVNNTVE